LAHHYYGFLLLQRYYVSTLHSARWAKFDLEMKSPISPFLAILE
jgi:hypothetical protein